MAVKKHSSSKKDGNRFKRPKRPLAAYRDDTNVLVATDSSFGSDVQDSKLPDQSPDISDDLRDVTKYPQGEPPKRSQGQPLGVRLIACQSRRHLSLFGCCLHSAFLDEDWLPQVAPPRNAPLLEAEMPQPRELPRWTNHALETYFL
jgi:hypothetical protein